MRSDYGSTMSRQIPYLQRRGHGLSFRIAVPFGLWPHVGRREIVKALPTSDRKLATTMALSFAGQAKLLFLRMRDVNNGKKAPPDTWLTFGYTLEYEFDQAGGPKRIKIQAEPHEQQAVDSAIRTAIESGAARAQISNSMSRTEEPVPTAQAHQVPMLSAVIDDFLKRFDKVKKAAMFKKHKPVLSMVLEVIGDKPVDELKQGDFNNFFDLLGRLPPRWRDECRKRSLSVRDLAEEDHPVKIAPKTFEDTYLASIRPFLIAVKRNFQDQGFPLCLPDPSWCAPPSMTKHMQTASQVRVSRGVFQQNFSKAVIQDPGSHSMQGHSKLLARYAGGDPKGSPPGVHAHAETAKHPVTQQAPVHCSASTEQ